VKVFRGVGEAGKAWGVRAVDIEVVRKERKV